MLLKGVIDCPDLPLNVSRSFLQNDADVQKISKHISKKVSDKLHSVFTEERDNYNKYWDDISPFIKFGCIREESFYDRVKDILLLRTINDEFLTLKEFPKQQDGKIFYVSDENVQAQYVRAFKAQGLNAAILTHMIDPHFVSFIEYKDKDCKFARIDSEIGDAMKGDSPAEGQDKIIEIFKKSIDNSDVTVKAETLKTADLPAVMLLSEYSRRMQDMSRAYGEAFNGMKDETTVVLNLTNDLVKSIPNLSEENQKVVCRHIYDLALLSHKPLSADEMAGFISRSLEILKIVADKNNG